MFVAAGKGHILVGIFVRIVLEESRQARFLRGNRFPAIKFYGERIGESHSGAKYCFIVMLSA